MHDAFCTYRPVSVVGGEPSRPCICAELKKARKSEQERIRLDVTFLQPVDWMEDEEGKHHLIWKDTVLYIVDGETSGS